MNMKEIYRQTKILIVDDEAPIRDILSANFRDEEFQVFVAGDGESGLKAIQDHRPDIIFQDIWMPGSIDGIEVLQKARELDPQLNFVMISGHGTIETAVKATKLGAWDFIEKPLSMDKIFIVIGNILSYQQERAEKNALLNKLRRSIALIGEAPGMMSVKQLISRVAPSASWVLLQGESGSGKELIAQNIHYMSPRASKSFVDINCASVPEDLLEAEIFGIEKGAWPGVDKTRKGKIDLAMNGTLFIEEISEMNLNVQVRFLKVLQEMKFQRVGGSENVNCDVRVIASSSKNLEDLVREGKFREDLFYRLNVIPFQVPSLREHPEDIPILVTHFSDIVSKENGTPRKAFSEQAIRSMKGYVWPGNVRELKNFIERVYILTPGEFVDVHDLRFAGLIEKQDGMTIDTEMSTFRDARAKFEKEYLVKKIEENGGNISKTAESIGLERSYLHRKIKSYGIET